MALQVGGSFYHTAAVVHARSLRPLVKTRAFGMTPCLIVGCQALLHPQHRTRA